MTASVHDVLVGMGSDQDPKWVTVIDPDGGDLARTRHWAIGNFGKERVLEVRSRGAVAVQTRPGRHRWEKVELHQYRCLRCATVKRNRRDEAGQWFQTFQGPGGREQRSNRVPPCGGTPQATTTEI